MKTFHYSLILPATYRHLAYRRLLAWMLPFILFPSVFLTGPAVAQVDLTFEQRLTDGAGQRRARAVAPSPDGAHVYTVADTGCVMASERDDGTGALTVIQVLCGNQADADWDDEGEDLVISPDGKHVYLAADGLAVLDRDLVTGRLTPRSFLFDGVDGNLGIDRTSGLVLDPNGEFLYVSARPATVAVYARDETTGDLTFVQVLFDNQNGVDGISEANGLDLSPDATHLYVVSGFSIGSDDDAVAVFSRASDTGELTFVEALFDGQNGVDGLDNADSVAVSPDGKHVYVTGQEDDAVAVFSRNAGDGRLTFIQAVANNQNGVTQLDSPTGIVVRPDGKVVSVSAARSDAVVVFSRDSMTGSLSLVQEGTNGSLGTNGIHVPLRLAYDPDGEHMYVSNLASGPGDRDGLIVLASDAGTGSHTLVQYLDDDTSFYDGLDSVRRVVLTQDGRHLYASAGNDRAVSHWNRDGSTGHLSWVAVYRAGDGGPSDLDEPVSMVLSPDETHLYVAALSSPLIIIFERDATSGALTFVAELEPPNAGDLGPVVMSPDGLFVYASDLSNHEVLVYGRDPASGELSFLQALTDGIDAQGIDTPESMVLGPTGAELYVGGSGANAVARFTRDSQTGLLTFVEQLVDGVDGVDGIGGVNSLALSPNGEQLYALGRDDNAVAHFTRNAMTGALTFVGARLDGVGGVDGLNNPTSLVVSADGRLVMIGSTGDSGIAIFLRDPVDGTLSFGNLATRRFDESANDVAGLTLSPDGLHLYVTYDDADALVVESLPVLLFADGFESGDTSRWTSAQP